MSYYYDYYFGYIDRNDGKIYPLGPYTKDGKLTSAFYRSRSFASDLHDDFNILGDEQMSDELKKCFTYKDYNNEERVEEIRYLSLSALPTGDGLVRGYFPREDVHAHESREDNGMDDRDMACGRISGEEYAAMLVSEAQVGPKKPYKDEYGDMVTPLSAADYMPYAFVNHESKEYEANLLRELIDSFTLDHGFYTGEKTAVILETEG